MEARTFAHDADYVSSFFRFETGGVPRDLWAYRLRNGSPVFRYLGFKDERQLQIAYSDAHVDEGEEERSAVMVKKALCKPELFEEIWCNYGLKDVAEAEVRERVAFLELLRSLLGEQIKVWAVVSRSKMTGRDKDVTLVRVNLQELTVTVRTTPEFGSQVVEEVLRPAKRTHWTTMHTSIWRSKNILNSWLTVYSGGLLQHSARLRGLLELYLPKDTAKIVGEYDR